MRDSFAGSRVKGAVCMFTSLFDLAQLEAPYLRLVLLHLSISLLAVAAHTSPPLPAHVSSFLLSISPSLGNCVSGAYAHRQRAMTIYRAARAPPDEKDHYTGAQFAKRALAANPRKWSDSYYRSSSGGAQFSTRALLAPIFIA